MVLPSYNLAAETAGPSGAKTSRASGAETAGTSRAGAKTAKTAGPAGTEIARTAAQTVTPRLPNTYSDAKFQPIGSLPMGCAY